MNAMTRTSILLLALAAGAVQAAQPAPGSAPAALHPGKALFDRWCAECHAPGHGHPGTQQLERIRGAKLAVLEQRRDLTPDVVRAFVRNGMNAMPAYRPSEITDADLSLIGSYLSRTKVASQQQRRVSKSD